MDEEWVALLEEARELGLTAEEIRDWLKQHSESEEIG
jgi:DNA-binding transcriptional MerR regulator